MAALARARRNRAVDRASRTDRHRRRHGPAVHPRARMEARRRMATAIVINRLRHGERNVRHSRGPRRLLVDFQDGLRRFLRLRRARPARRRAPPQNGGGAVKRAFLPALLFPARLAAPPPTGTPLYGELNFRRYQKLPLLRLKSFAPNDDGEAEALRVGKLYYSAP